MSAPVPSPAAPVWRFSPSAVEDFLACPARWGFAKLPGGTPEPGNDATEFGTETHTEREKYLEHCKVFGSNTPYAWPDTRPGVVAKALTAYLPKGIPPYAYWEEDHEYDAGDGIVLHGFPDFAWPDPRESLAVTADYKTTGNFKWAKLDRNALFGHAQAPLYVLMNMRKWGFDKGRALWLYAERPPLVPPYGDVRVEPSDHLITRDEATERVHLRMVPPAKQMLGYLTSGMTAADAPKLPKNLRHCRAYNKLCPRLATCQPEKKQHMSDQANLFLAGLGLAPTPATPAAGANTPGTPEPATLPTNTAPPDAGATAGASAPDTSKAANVNPPESNGKKGKGRAQATGKLDPADIDAIAEAVADKLALRLMRNIP